MSDIPNSSRELVVQSADVSEWSDAAEVIVVGSGASGLVTALTAADGGASVLVLEKAPTFGGTTAKSGGGVWVPNNRHMAELGIRDDRNAALRYMARTAAAARYRSGGRTLGLHTWEFELLEAAYDDGANAFAELERMDGLHTLALADLPNYYSEIAENTVPYGRSLCPCTPDGEPADGPEMVRQLRAAIARRNGRERTAHRVVGVVVDETGTTCGVLADTASGRRALHASKAVVFATGGFTHNPELCVRYLPGPRFGGCAVLTNEGDFVPIAQRLGAALANMSESWNAPLVLERALRSDPTLTSTFNIVGDSMLLVNRFGRRVMNEKAVYNEAVHPMLVWDDIRAEYPNLLLFAIWDQRTMETFAGTPYDGGMVPGSGEEASHLLEGDTAIELASELERRLSELSVDVALAAGFADQLRASIARFNAFARAGRDDDFHRGESVVELHMQHLQTSAAELGVTSPSMIAARADKSHRREQTSPAPSRPVAPNPTMYPLNEHGPYYATILAPGMLDTKGGPITDQYGRVVDHLHKPIPRLYAVGNCAASPSGPAYWGAGATLGPMITYAWLAGCHTVTLDRTEHVPVTAVRP